MRIYMNLGPSYGGLVTRGELKPLMLQRRGMKKEERSGDDGKAGKKEILIPPSAATQ
jgi:hypothetical protein